MQATIAQTELNKSLQLVSRVVTNKNQVPVLANVLLEATKAGLILAATNLEMGLRVEIGGKVTQDGALTVPARNLSEFVSSLASGNLDLSAAGDKLKIMSGRSSAMFAGISASEFPSLPKIVEAHHDAPLLGSQMMRDIAIQVAFAAAIDDSRPVLTGVKFVQGLVLATDGFRLSRKILNLGQLKTDLVIPARTILELARISEHEQDIVMEVTPENNQVIFSCGSIQLISRVLEGNFPDVNKVIPVEWKTQVILDRQEFLRALKAAGIFARENNNIIRFIIKNSQFTISASAAQLGESTVEVEAEVEGEEGEIAFNYKYLLDFLNSIGSERIIFRMNDKLSPGLFVPEKDDSLVHVIMPVRA